MTSTYEQHFAVLMGRNVKRAKVSRRCSVWLGTLFLLTGCTNHASKTDALPSGSQAASWQTLTSTAGGYSISMPGTPEYKDNQGNGHKYILSTDNSHMIYCVLHFDMASTPKTSEQLDHLLLRMRDAELKQQQTTAKSQRQMTIAQHSALEVTFEAPTQDGDTSLGTMRFLVVKNKMYELAVIRSKAQGDEASANRFLDSLQFLP